MIEAVENGRAAAGQDRRMWSKLKFALARVNPRCVLCPGSLCVPAHIDSTGPRVTSQSMQAAVYTQTKSGKVLEVKTLAQPVPKDDEVLIRVRAASVNPLDWRLKSQRPGVDLAGEVVTVGAKATQFKPGDAVFGAGKGAFAEYACAVEHKLAPKPENISFEQAAAVPIAGLTALQGIRDKAHLRPGERVLINGASGGVGTFAVQIAKLFGAHVTGVCSTKNVELVRSLGAEHVIDYTTDDFAQRSEDYDLILDNVGNRRLSEMKRVLAPDGRCVMAGAPKQIGPMFGRIVESFARRLILRQKFIFYVATISRRDLGRLCELIGAGQLKPVIDKRYPLSETATALAYVEAGHARAKVIIAPQ